MPHPKGVRLDGASSEAFSQTGHPLPTAALSLQNGSKRDITENLSQRRGTTFLLQAFFASIASPSDRRWQFVMLRHSAFMPRFYSPCTYISWSQRSRMMWERDLSQVYLYADSENFARLLYSSNLCNFCESNPKELKTKHFQTSADMETGCEMDPWRISSNSPSTLYSTFRGYQSYEGWVKTGPRTKYPPADGSVIVAVGSR